jgi:hypothetical protein
MRQAIQTKFFGPTNTRGARVKASAQVGSVVIPYDYSLFGQERAHAEAAKRLAARYGWGGRWFGGANADGKGYTFVCVDSTTADFEVVWD